MSRPNNKLFRGGRAMAREYSRGRAVIAAE